MANNVNIIDLADEITRAIREYTQDVSEGIDRVVDKTSRDALAEVKHLAPRRCGNYAEGFVGMNKSLPGNRRYVVWNPKYYRLVHLLEHGHAKANGVGRVAGKPHMGPAEARHVMTMPDRIKRVIENGG